jgi:hypothetical protein
MIPLDKSTVDNLSFLGTAVGMPSAVDTLRAAGKLVLVPAAVGSLQQLLHSL